MQNLVAIDGIYYDLIIPEDGIKRSFSVLDDEDSGRVKSGKMWRSIIGTYYNYTILFDTSRLNQDAYTQLDQTISAPVASHILTVPYNQELLTFEAYITGGEDTLRSSTEARGNDWHGLSLQFVATEPERT